VKERRCSGEGLDGFFLSKKSKGIYVISDPA
jgi:hypothetical protein